MAEKQEDVLPTGAFSRLAGVALNSSYWSETPEPEDDSPEARAEVVAFRMARSEEKRTLEAAVRRARDYSDLDDAARELLGKARQAVARERADDEIAERFSDDGSGIFVPQEAHEAGEEIGRENPLIALAMLQAAAGGASEGQLAKLAALAEEPGKATKLVKKAGLPKTDRPRATPPHHKVKDSHLKKPRG
jgi:hypothetical protein